MSRAGDQDRLEVHIKHKSYRKASGGELQVLGALSIAVASGEIAALIGPSGCGKTTLLRIIVGLDSDFEGTVRLPAHGRLGVVFQEPRLLPWRTVEENVRLAAPQASDAALDGLFGTLELSAHRRHYPGELSLGLARRTALARAFAVEPELLVLDEPFVSLDAELATRLRAELAELVARRPVTTASGQPRRRRGDRAGRSRLFALRQSRARGCRRANSKSTQRAERGRGGGDPQ